MRVVAQQRANQIFLLRNLSLGVGNGLGGGLDQLLGLADIQQARRATVGKGIGQLQRFLAGSQSFAGDVQFKIEFP